MTAKLKDTGVLIVVCVRKLRQEPHSLGYTARPCQRKPFFQVEVVQRNKRGLTPIVPISCVILAKRPLLSKPQFL